MKWVFVTNLSVLIAFFFFFNCCWENQKWFFFSPFKFYPSRLQMNLPLIFEQTDASPGIIIKGLISQSDGSFLRWAPQVSPGAPESWKRLCHLLMSRTRECQRYQYMWSSSMHVTMGSVFIPGTGGFILCICKVESRNKNVKWLFCFFFRFDVNKSDFVQSRDITTLTQWSMMIIDHLHGHTHHVEDVERAQTLSGAAEPGAAHTCRYRSALIDPYWSVLRDWSCDRSSGVGPRWLISRY